MERTSLSIEQTDAIQKKQLLLLSGAHLINDAYAGFLAPLLPLLVDKFHLTLAAAGFLSSVLAISSSLTQPLFGYLADRLGRRYFVVLGPFITSVFMSSLGLPEHYTLLVIIVFIGGMGIAFFHPQGAALAGAAGGRHKGFGMSFFSAGGNAGYALGPLFILPVVSGVGLEYAYIVVVPGVVLSILLYKYLSMPISLLETEENAIRTERVSLQLRTIVLLWLIVFFRALIVMSFGTYIPLLLKERGYSFMVGGTAIFIFLFCGAFGGLLGGYLSDRLGRKRIILLSLGLPTPLLLVFLYISGAWSNIGLGLAGASLLSSIPVGIVMAQEFTPKRTSTISGLMIGFAWGIAGLGVSLVGMLADTVGLTKALTSVAFLPLLGFMCGLGLPEK